MITVILLLTTIQSTNVQKRIGKGSNILTLVRTFLNESENWKEIKEKQCYQFPGVFSSASLLHCWYEELASKQWNRDKLFMDLHSTVKRSTKQGTFNYCENLWKTWRCIVSLCSMSGSKILSWKGLQIYRSNSWQKGLSWSQ